MSKLPVISYVRNMFVVVAVAVVFVVVVVVILCGEGDRNGLL